MSKAQRTRKFREEQQKANGSSSVPTIVTAEIATKLKKWKVAIREEPETVIHQTYGFGTVLNSEQFAIYEGALKAIYTHWFISCHAMGANPLGVLIHHQAIGDKNGIVLPWIAQNNFNDRNSFTPSAKGRQRSDDASEDYHFFVNILRGQVGKDATTGEERNLYYATLD